MNANKFTKRVYAFRSTSFGVIKGIVILNINGKMSLGIFCISFETVINIVTGIIYISISIGKRSCKTPPPAALYLQVLQNMHAQKELDVNDLKNDYGWLFENYV